MSINKEGADVGIDRLCSLFVCMVVILRSYSAAREGSWKRRMNRTVWRGWKSDKSSGGFSFSFFRAVFVENCSINNTAGQASGLQGMISIRLDNKKEAAAPQVGRVQRLFLDRIKRKEKRKSI